MEPSERVQVAQRFQDLLRSLEAESDRGCVLVVCILVEESLQEHISAYLIPAIGKEDDLMGRSANQPISGFSSKINLAYRLGLIRRSERAMYHQLRELRNACAHHIDHQDFGANHFIDRTRNIIQQSTTIWEALLEVVTPKLPADSQPKSVEQFVEKLGWRNAFAMFFSLVVAYMEAATKHIARLETAFEPEEVDEP
jgi:hypothetical protein